MTEPRELLHIVCKKPVGEVFRVAPHETLPLMNLELASGCTACEACFRVCPTGAIQVGESAEEWVLSFHAERCVACGVCLEVCQPGVLRSGDAFDAAPGRPPRVLYALRKQRCARCDRFFVSPEPRTTCAVCSQDEDCFAEIFG
jgi:formate hydrogenlyase subunit 6/NADH:ubiquinone oxidoreductase subunit I